MRRLEAYWLAAAELGEELDDYAATRRRAQRIGELRVTRPTGPDHRLTEATAAYHRRLAELQRKAAGVVAVDPGVRRLRDRVVAALAPAAEIDVARHVDSQRARWHLRRGDPPAPRPLALGTDREPFSTTPTGNRLVVELEEDLVELDLDSGTGRVVDGSSVYGMAAAGRFVAYVDDDEANVVEVGTTTRPRGIGPADYIVDTDDGRTVWLVTGAEDDEGPRTLNRVDVISGATLATLTVPGEVEGAAGRHVAVSRFSGRTSGIELWDVERRTVVRRMSDADFLDLRGDLLVWREASIVHFTSLATGHDRIPPAPEPNAFAADAEVAPDGGSVAVLWSGGRRLSTLSLLSLGTTDDVSETARADLGQGNLASSATWSPDGKRVYFVLEPFELEGLADIAVFHVADRRFERLPLEGTVYDMAAF